MLPQRHILCLFFVLTGLTPRLKCETLCCRIHEMSRAADTSTPSKPKRKALLTLLLLILQIISTLISSRFDPPKRRCTFKVVRGLDFRLPGVRMSAICAGGKFLSPVRPFDVKLSAFVFSAAALKEAMSTTLHSTGKLVARDAPPRCNFRRWSCLTIWLPPC